jgi:predicted site-specific integrase-resolvase
MKKLVKPEDICETLGVCRRTLSRWEDQGLIRPIKVNARVFRYDPEDVEAMILTLKGEAA